MVLTTLKLATWTETITLFCCPGVEVGVIVDVGVGLTVTVGVNVDVEVGVGLTVMVGVNVDVEVGVGVAGVVGKAVEVGEVVVGDAGVCNEAVILVIAGPPGMLILLHATNPVTRAKIKSSPIDKIK
jgi:hypothetical protein